ncbi:MAG: ABC transporter ATP-binding protein [Clostridia bacterium]|nr:ABC transporter ATP-binding protein [Clostridia bacterium]
MNYYEEEFETKKVDIRTWKKLLQYAARHKKALIIMSISMVIIAVFDVIIPYMRSYAIDEYILQETTKGLGWFTAIYMSVSIVVGYIVYLFIYKAGFLETYITYDIRRDAFNNLQKLSFSYYDVTPVGFIMARMTSDAVRLGETIAWALVDMVWGAFFMVAALIGMFIMNWRLALIVLVVVPPIAIISAYFSKIILKYQRRVKKTNSRITSAFNEGIMGARTTKSLHREDANFKEFDELTGKMRNSSIKAAVISAIYMPIVMTIGAAATGAMLWLGGEQVLSTAIKLGELNFFISMSTMFFEPIYQISRIFAELQSSQAAAERVIGLVEAKSDIIDAPEVIENYGDAIHPKKENWPDINGEVEFKNVTFKYKGGEKVLSDFDLKVKAGSTIAIVGETGSGKSTIVNLLCRFYEPTDGEVLIDGKNYKKYPQIWLHSNLGYVLQTPFLFSGTIMDNIRYGKLDATDEEVIEAAKLVDADAFINKLPEGYSTSVGEGGSKLSTGEKQLVSFARAILANPALFVLDEATSSIDTETEAKIQNAIEKVLTGRTSFIIAHRLSTIRHANRIIVISKGKIIEDGTHKELMKNKKHYYELYTNQFKQEQENEILGIAN